MIAASETGDRSPRWVGPHGPALASMGQQALARTQGRESGGENLELRLPCGSNIVHDGKRRFGTQRHDHVPNTSLRSHHQLNAGFQNSARNAETRLVAPLSLLSASTQSGNTRVSCRGGVDRAFADPVVHKRCGANEECSRNSQVIPERGTGTKHCISIGESRELMQEACGSCRAVHHQCMVNAIDVIENA